MNTKVFLLILSALVSSGKMASLNTQTASSNMWSLLLSHFLASLFPDSKIVLIYGDFFRETAPLEQRFLWLDRLDSVMSQKHIISNSGGVMNMKLLPNQSDFEHISRYPNTKSDIIQVVLLLLPVQHENANVILFHRLNVPLLQPTTNRNADKHFIITDKANLNYFYEMDVIRRTKYKVFITPDEEELKFIQYCPHCPIPENVLPIADSADAESNLTNLLTIRDYFPDFQLNYYGHILRVSSTDKMIGDLEFAVDENGHTYGKRGVFAAAMYHLAEGLNFTAQLYVSTAGASTGHTLPNGTWVGSVGDVLSGDAAFCMLCGMSYSRHSFVEICSPVTYEYIRFAIGPTDKLYTAMSLFWPFDVGLWLAFIASFLLCTLVSFLIMKVHNKSSWNAYTVAQYFGRMFIEQGDDIPEHGLAEALKIILGYWLLFVMIATTLYRAKMVTFMTFPIYEKAPDTYEELVKSPYQIVFHYFPNIAYNSFKASTNPIIMEVFQKMIKETDAIKCMQDTLEIKSVCIMFTSVHDDTISRNMSDRHGMSPIKPSSEYAFMFTPGISSQKRADFTPNFRKILQTSLQMGLNEWWVRSDAYNLLKQKNKWIKSLPPGANRTGIFHYETESDDVLHLKHLKGAFSVLFGGFIVALIGFLWELSGKYLKKANLRRERAIKKWRQRKNLLAFLHSAKAKTTPVTKFGMTGYTK